jgi:hypothetical protein
MLFVDCIYLVCCNFYKSREKNSFKASGLILLSIVLVLNLMLFIFILSKEFKVFDFDLVYDHRYIAAMIYLPLSIALLYWRYYIVTSYDRIYSFINNLAESRKKRYYLLAASYVLLSIISTLTYIVYRGGKVNGWW